MEGVRYESYGDGLRGQIIGWDITGHLNAEFQRIARRDKKAFLSDQHKKIEENKRMGKTRSVQEN